MNFKIKLFFVIANIITPLTSFGLDNFAYSVSYDLHYNTKEKIGNDLVITKEFKDGTQDNGYWRIRPEDLPITETFCALNNFDFCLKEGDGCYKPCFQYGPQFITHSKNVNKIYFLIDTTEVGGTGIGSRLLFAGDLNKKQIKYLSITAGLLEFEYSPSKNYIVFYTNNELIIVNTLTDKIISIRQRNSQTKQYREVHYLDTVHWTSNHCFTYLDTSYSFAKQPTRIVKNIYDTDMHAIISSKRMR